VQLAFLAILVAALAVGLAALAWLGVSQRLRQGRLAMAADQLGLRFSATDPFEISRRYGGFVLAGAGHSPRAENVIYGRYGRRQMRAFDFLFELGHGGRRVTRRYSVVLAEIDHPAGSALLWHEQDCDHPPLAVQAAQGRLGPYLVVHGQELAPLLVEAFGAPGNQPMSIQLEAGTLLTLAPVRWRAADLPARLEALAAAIEHLHAMAKAQAHVATAPGF
jgi:hypothetical protein